jgi:hypothetical protein
MDAVLLFDICVAVSTALCVALLAYGAWLCVLWDPEPAEEASDVAAPEVVRE